VPSFSSNPGGRSGTTLLTGAWRPSYSIDTALSLRIPASYASLSDKGRWLDVCCSAEFTNLELELSVFHQGIDRDIAFNNHQAGVTRS
jgi:hypothetical protein